MNKYIVSMRVDGRIDVEVEAENPDAAKMAANVAFMEADLSMMDIVDAEPVNCSDDAGNIVKDY